MQIILDAVPAEGFYACRQIWPVVKGNVGGNVEELTFFLRRCYNCACHLPYVIALVGSVLVDILCSFVGTPEASGAPDCDDIASIKKLWFHNGFVERLDAMAEALELLQDGVDTRFVDAFWWELRNRVLFFDANDYVAAANVVYIVGEGANGMDDWLWIEVRLELDSCRFDCCSADELGNISWYCHGRLRRSALRTNTMIAFSAYALKKIAHMR